MKIAAVTTSYEWSKEEQTKQHLNRETSFRIEDACCCSWLVFYFVSFRFSVVFFAMKRHSKRQRTFNRTSPKHARIAHHVDDTLHAHDFSNAHTLHTWLNMCIAVSYCFVCSSNVFEAWRSSLSLILHAGHLCVCFIFLCLHINYIYGTSCIRILVYLRTC